MSAFDALAGLMAQPLEISVRDETEGNRGKPMFIALVPMAVIDAQWEWLSQTLWYDRHRATLGPSLYWSQFMTLMGKQP